MIILFESTVMCFILLIICVIGIANGPVGLVTFYEKDVQDRVVELGLTTKERIKRNTLVSTIALFIPIIFLVPYMVYGVNGAETFRDGFVQMTVILYIMGLFDRIFIDWYWVGKTKTWSIPGTEDLKPYIPRKTLIIKWIGTLVTYPLFSAFTAWVMTIVIK
ncbi:MAG: hypothetical protein K2K57_07560 [Oscillospiraceae bacterium]|nr:hypothetical protein [Oscillospiraceae bacterium]